MDPFANLAEQRAFAERILAGQQFNADAERLAELVLALDEWRKAGGFDPYAAARR